jgi:hypothetical protein
MGSFFRGGGLFVIASTSSAKIASESLGLFLFGTAIEILRCGTGGGAIGKRGVAGSVLTATGAGTLNLIADGRDSGTSADGALRAEGGGAGTNAGPSEDVGAGAGAWGAASCLSVASVLVHTIYQPNKSEKEGHTFMEYSPELLCSSTNIGILTIVYYTIMHDPFHVVCEFLPGGILPTCQFRSSSFQVHGLLDNSEVAVYQLHFVLSA